ncbi:MAG: 30S ribosomal protein S20 [Gemmatimonadaceae bacterium]
MPNIKSSKKDMRRSRVAAARNKAQRSALRLSVKRAKATAAKPEDKTDAISMLDRSARKGLIHRNTAARQKSKMMKAKAAA